MSAVHFDQLIINAAVNRGVLSKPRVYTMNINSDNLKANCYTNL